MNLTELENIMGGANNSKVENGCGITNGKCSAGGGCGFWNGKCTGCEGEEFQG